ncbi:NAD(P)H-dependent oxidoreductase [Brevibacillus brevis]|uniref:NAD(P)H-dependent oxidoreductase n=1 Tax=Brevibacillus brevis TaxID=1393 RepID=A0ABY9T136_BREBE|nr:NAD(P)H-dependent oxidoreductase [Brevibacillus brevis]WNC13822.1 NAD(P)H-dependent oxidoreductase [Brevibacillus brevis]
MKKELSVLAISGSLRKHSSNTALMNAMIGLAPSRMDWKIYQGLGDLPHFNPDDDHGDGPVEVRELRAHIQAADAVLICTPEYANGVPGVLKNALDWLVSTTVFLQKPTAVISASPTPMGGDKAHASLLLTLGMINAAVVEGGTLIIPHITMKMDKNGAITDEQLRADLSSVLQALERACR